MTHRIATIGLTLALSACGPRFEATVPPSFVELDDEHDAYDFRATTADGLVIAIRELEHKPKGEPQFWLQAIKNKLRDQGGYALLESVEVATGDGHKGTQLRFGHDEDGKPYLFYVSVFVTKDHLHLIEFGGSKEQFTASQKELDLALSTLRLN
ncbi:MAG: serine/threonine protein kinase [Myxococcales bacterium]|nr:serine/threonine protein kinase [Myxococcales bacterium]